MSLLDVSGLSCRFGSQTALSDISFQVDKGEIVGVIGSSGAGKSTLLRCLCALERPTEGHILLDGADLTQLSERDLVAARRKVGLVFQHFNLLNSRSVAANIALPLEIAGWPKPRIAERVEELLALVGLESHGHKRPSQLSGGQKQRVGIARAIANSPSLLLCDEATSALDPHTTASILELLADINRTLGLTIILITHEMEVVRRFAHRVLVLDHGALIENGSMATLMRDSRGDPRLERLLADTRPGLPETIKRQLSADPVPGGLTLMRIVLGPEAAKTPFLSLLTTRFDQQITLVQGGTLSCGGDLLTDMILAFSAPVTEPLSAFLEQQAHVTEVLGHVPSDR
ncbi:ATP-binding cassette domain-containing protein [Asaia siamensis]